MSLDEWEVGDYVVGDVEAVGRDGFRYLGTGERVRVLCDTGRDERVVAEVTDTRAAGVVAEPVSGIESGDATVWVQRTADSNPRDPESAHPSNTFDAMTGDEVAERLSGGGTTTRAGAEIAHTASGDGTATDDGVQLGLVNGLKYGTGAILAGLFGLLLVGYAISALIPPEGTAWFVLSAALTVATPIFWGSLTLLVAGVVAVAAAVDDTVRD